MHLRPPVIVIVAVLGLLWLPVPAHAGEQCLADGVDDLLDLVTGSGSARNPNADIEAACVTHSPGQIDLSARLGAATDVASYPAWETGRSALVFQVDVDPDLGGSGPNPAEGREYDVVIGRAAGAAAYSVIRVATEEVTCGAPLAPENLPTPADPTFRLGLDTAVCIPGPDGEAPPVIRAGAYLLFQEEGANPTLDEVPVLEERYGAAIGTEPRPAVVGFRDVLRLSGPTRIETAIAVSGATFPEAGSAAAVVLATGEPPAAPGSRATSSPDALAAAPLAVHLGGPVLLLGGPSPQMQLSDAVLREIQRVLPDGGPVALVGGEAVIHPAVEERLAADGYTVERLAGTTREATALRVALRIDGEPTRIVLADGGSFEYALLGASYAAATNRLATGPDGGRAGRAVLLLTRQEGGTSVLDPLYEPYLRTDRPGREIVVVGRAAAEAASLGGLEVSPDNTLVAADGSDDALATSVAVADRYDGGGAVTPQPSADPSVPPPLDGIRALDPPATVVVVSSTSFADAISGGTLAGLATAPLLLSRSDSLPAPTRAYLRGLERRLTIGYLVGGPAVLRDDVGVQLSNCGTLPPGDTTPECRPA